MKLAISRSSESLWVWLFWGIGIYLLLELGPFFIAGAALKKTAGELVGPYLAFAAPWAIMAPSIWWLRKWEEQGASAKKLARGWGLSMALFGFMAVAALFYSGVMLGLMDLSNAVGGFIVAVLLCIPIFYFGMYYRALKVVTSRASRNSGGTR